MGSFGDSGVWGSLVPGGPLDATGGIDLQAVIDEILPTLHSDSRANLTFWTAQQLADWMDEALKRLARVTGTFVGRDTSQATVSGTSSYTLHARHLATLHVSQGNSPLRPANTIELEMRDPDYRTVAATVADPSAYWYEDLEGNAAVGLTPVPIDAANLNVVCQAWPSMVTASGATLLVLAPPLVAPYVVWWTIWRCYSAEGESEMPDVALAAKAHCDLLEGLFRHLFGEGVA